MRLMFFGSNQCNDFINSNTATGGYFHHFFVDVELDPLFILDNASMPYTGLGNNVFQFQLDCFKSGESITINLSTTLSCNAFFVKLCVWSQFKFV